MSETVHVSLVGDKVAVRISGERSGRFLHMSPETAEKVATGIYELTRTGEEVRL